jgi:Ras-related protein Rab-5C
MSARPLPKRRFKVVLLGDSHVGKSSLIIRYHNNSYDSIACETVGNAFVEHGLRLSQEDIVLEIWDTPGQEHFASASRLLVRDAHCCIIVYDVSKLHTFDSVATHAQRYLDACLAQPLVVIAANKHDLLANDEAKRDAVTEGLSKLHENNGWQTFLVSAKTGEQVRELFEYCGEQVVDLSGGKLMSERASLTQVEKQSKRWC